MARTPKSWSNVVLVLATTSCLGCASVREQVTAMLHPQPTPAQETPEESSPTTLSQSENEPAQPPVDGQVTEAAYHLSPENPPQEQLRADEPLAVQGEKASADQTWVERLFGRVWPDRGPSMRVGEAQPVDADVAGEMSETSGRRKESPIAPAASTQTEAGKLPPAPYSEVMPGEESPRVAVPDRTQMQVAFGLSTPADAPPQDLDEAELQLLPTPTENAADAADNEPSSKPSSETRTEVELAELSPSDIGSADELVRQARRSFTRVKNYRARMLWQVRENDELSAPKTLYFRMRKEPEAIHVAWNLDPLEGRHWLYVPSENDGRILVREPTSLGRLSMYVEPTDETVLNKLHRPVTEYGPSGIVGRLAAALVERDEGKATVEYRGLSERDEFDEALYKVVVVRGEGERTEFYFEQEELLPVLVIERDEDGRLVEYEFYDHLQTNVESLARPVAFDAETLFRR